MKKTKVTEEQIVKVLRDPLYTSDRQRALALGETPNGGHTKKFRELREKYGIPQPEPGKRGRTAGHDLPKSQPDTLKFSDIRKEDRLMKGGKRLVVISAGEEGLSYRTMDGSIKFLHRKDFEKNAAEYTKVPLGDPQGAPVKTYIDPTQKLSAGDIMVNGQPIKNLPDNVKEKIVKKMKEQVAPDPPIIPSLIEGRKPATINQDFEAAVKEMEAKNEIKPEPIHLDLEMEPNTDETAYYKEAEPVFKFEPIDYTDSDWLAIPAKGSIEYRIWERAYNEIEEYHRAKNEVEQALISGGRLPTQITEKYNRIVSKYCEEAGA